MICARYPFHSTYVPINRTRVSGAHLFRTMKFGIEATSSYSSIPPTYHCAEQFSNNVETYRVRTKWFGVFLAFLSGTFFTISSSLVKAVRNVDPMTLLAIRATLQISTMLAVALRNSQHLLGPKGLRMLVQFQGFVGGMTLSLLYHSFRRLPIGDATTIIFSSPVIVIALSFAFLREPCGFLRVVVACALFGGVVLVSRPPFIFQTHKSVPYDAVGYVYAILATLFTALNVVIMRKCLEVHYSVIVLNLSAWSFVAAIIFYFVVSEREGRYYDELPADWRTWAGILAVAFSGLAGQVLVAKALKIEGAAKVSTTRSLDIILAYIVQVYFFRETPNGTGIVGAILVLLSVVCMGFETEIYGICDFIP